MGRCKPKPNQKHQRDDDKSLQPQSSECQQLQTAGQSTTTKITDLNDDCLVKCFKYLDLISLFKVSVASKWLRPAANDVYNRKFGSNKVRFRGKCLL